MISPEGCAGIQAPFNAISEAGIDALQSGDEAVSNVNITESLQLLRFAIKGHATLFILSDFKYMTALKALVALTKRCQVYCIDIYDVIEEVPPQSGEYSAEYNGDKLVFDSTPETFKQTYYTYFSDKRKYMENFCKRFGCHYLSIRTDRPLYKQLKIL